jgi:hypothetical protein
MPAEPFVLKGFWAEIERDLVSFKKIREWPIPNFEKQNSFIKQLLRKPKFFCLLSSNRYRTSVCSNHS